VGSWKGDHIIIMMSQQLELDQRSDDCCLSRARKTTSYYYDERNADDHLPPRAKMPDTAVA